MAYGDVIGAAKMKRNARHRQREMWEAGKACFGHELVPLNSDERRLL